MIFRLKYVVEDTDRHGNVRLYYRRHGRKVRLRGPAGSPESWRITRQPLPVTPRPPRKSRGAGHVVPRSIRWLCVQYYKSAMFKELDPRTQKVRRAILERFCQHKSDGDKPFALLFTRHVRIGRDEMSERPEAANGMVKALRQLYRFALRYDLHDDNPAEKVEYLKGNPDGFHSWTLDEIARFEEVHPVGTQARLALTLAVYTGQRRSDLVLFARQHVQGRVACVHATQGPQPKPGPHGNPDHSRAARDHRPDRDRRSCLPYDRLQTPLYLKRVLEPLPQMVRRSRIERVFGSRATQGRRRAPGAGLDDDIALVIDPRGREPLCLANISTGKIIVHGSVNPNAQVGKGVFAVAFLMAVVLAVPGFVIFYMLVGSLISPFYRNGFEGLFAPLAQIFPFILLPACWYVSHRKDQTLRARAKCVYGEIQTALRAEGVIIEAEPIAA